MIMQWLDLLSRKALLITLFVFGLLGAVRIGVWHYGQIRLIGQAASPDTYIFDTVEHYIKKGQIYPEITETTTIPPVYSPMLYISMALPTRLVASENRFLPARTFQIIMFGVALALLYSITERLIPFPYAGVWSVLLACTYTVSWVHSGALRADYPAVVCSLAAIRLLLSRRHTIMTFFMAGFFAGFELQFKLTMMTAAASGVAWLLWQKKWRPLLIFCAGLSLSSIVLYGYFLMAEPYMTSSITKVFGKPLWDIKGAIDIYKSILREPVVLIGLATLPFSLTRFPSRFLLLAISCFVSFSIAASTVVQVGAGEYYFLEAIYLLTIFATMGIFWLRARAKGPIGLFLCSLFLVNYVLPIFRQIPVMAYNSTKGVSVRNIESKKMEELMRGEKALPVTLSAATFASEVVLKDPGALGILEAQGTYAAEPVVKQIEAGLFDIVIVDKEEKIWRGFSLVPPRLRAAISGAYSPYGTLGDWLVLTPKERPLKPEMRAKLERLTKRCNGERECQKW
jgi:hypothetical protein